MSEKKAAYRTKNKKPNLKDFSAAYREFVYHETASKDTIDVKKVYIDMAGNIAYGVLLSQIVYWHLPDRQGIPKQRKFREGHWWIAKGYDDWWGEARVTRDQADKGIRELRKRGFVETRRWKFDGVPTVHIRLTDVFFEVFNLAIEFLVEASQERIRKVFWDKELRGVGEMDFAFWRDRIRPEARWNSPEGEILNRDHGIDHGLDHPTKENSFSHNGGKDSANDQQQDAKEPFDINEYKERIAKAAGDSQDPDNHNAEKAGPVHNELDEFLDKFDPVREIEQYIAKVAVIPLKKWDAKWDKNWGDPIKEMLVAVDGDHERLKQLIDQAYRENEKFLGKATTASFFTNIVLKLAYTHQQPQRTPRPAGDNHHAEEKSTSRADQQEVMEMLREAKSKFEK